MIESYQREAKGWQVIADGFVRPRLVVKRDLQSEPTPLKQIAKQIFEQQYGMDADLHIMD